MNTLVSFELARLLKEKGFNIEKQNFYNSYGQLNKDIEDFFIPRYEAPTISDVVMWLYEKHGIWIAVDLDDDDTFVCVVRSESYVTAFDNTNTPTEAYLQAIEYTLKNLI